jgi:regulatory protein
MPTLTKLSRSGPGRVALEVDGTPWRTVPAAVVVRAGLAAGLALDRPTLRRVRTELRRAKAQAVAGRALARRDLTARELEARLERAGLAPDEIEETTAKAVSLGVVDDERFARARADQLAERGYGDAYVRAKLRAAGVTEALTREAVERLPPETGRARPLVERRAADPRKTAAYLVRRGFAPDTIEEVLAVAANLEA